MKRLWVVFAALALAFLLAGEAQAATCGKPGCDNDLVCLCTPAGSGGWWRRDCRKPGGGWDQIRAGCQCEWWR